MQIPTNTYSTTDVAKTNSTNQLNSTEQANKNLSGYEQSKKAQDLAVLTASSNSAAGNPMKLLYKTAIEEINKQLEPIFGKNAAQQAYDSNLDVSPEATAERIVDGSVAFFEGFKAQNPDLSEEDALNEFMSVIGSGIEQGFNEARDILDSLKVLEGDIAKNIDLTFDFVQQGLTSFREKTLEGLAADNGENEGETKSDVEKVS